MRLFALALLLAASASHAQEAGEPPAAPSTAIRDTARPQQPPGQKLPLKPTRRFVADVSREGVDPAPVTLGDVVDDPLRIRIGRAPTGQHDVAGAELRQVGCRVQTERAQTTSDQITPVVARLKRFRYLQHDLSDMTRLLHSAECGLGFRQRVDLGG